MHTIRLDVNDSIFENVLFFLKNLPAKEIRMKIESTPMSETQNIVAFFQSSPLVGEVTLERNQEVYEDKGVEF